METQGPSAMRRTGRQSSRIFHWGCALTILASCVAGVASANDLLDAHAVLRDIKQNAPAQASRTSGAAALVSDVEHFRVSGEQLSPQQAAMTWFQLFDRAVNSASRANANDPGSFDGDLRRPVGVASVIAALPPPAAWHALQDEASKRAARAPADYHVLGLPLLSAVLLGDRTATESDLKSVDTVIVSLPPDQRILPRTMVTQIRRMLVKLYGKPSEIADALLGEVADAANGSPTPARYNTDVEVPDLVTLVGEADAAAILTKALSQPVTLHVESGDATRSLARRVALEHISALKLPQWGLADSVDAAPLYEALVGRFGAKAITPTADDASGPSSDFARQRADTYYLLFLIVNDRQSEAQKLLESMGAGQVLAIPRPAIKALEKAGRNDALYAFLGSVLSHHPDVRAWDVYIEQAAYTGHSKDALNTLDAVLKQPGLPPYLRADLQRRRADALLALGDTEHGLRALEALLQAPPATTDPYLTERLKAAIRLAGLGRVLTRPDLADKGLTFAQNAFALPPQRSVAGSERVTVLRSFFAEARKQHRESDVQRVAIAELKRRDPNADPAADQMEMVGMAGVRPGRRAALVELVSLYVGANRPADARILLDEADDWGARDLRELLGEKDSQGVPLALSAARALAATGENAAAVRVVTATIAQFPGYDGAYELESSIDPHAAEVFDEQFKTDQFQQRPLIWSAALLAHRAQYAAAEQTVRAAIAIDPSDGDEGINDRMRAYAVLSDILAAKGDAKGAADYRAVVTSIRISERADELHTLGLYQQAFAAYRKALDHFSDAYCIQSRLAVQLNQQGQHEQAAEHYRRAYELMPSSFGRVETHCFGCEGVFEGAQPQSIAEQVFQSLAKKEPRNAQVHYLQGYLYEEQGRYAEALSAFRTAVQIDSSYLNAWRHLNQLSSHIYLESADRDVIATRLLQLDPEQRHVAYDIGTVGDFSLLWNTVAEIDRARGAPPYGGPLYSLSQSAKLLDQKQSELPAELRNQIQQYQTLLEEARQAHTLPSPPLTLGKHTVLMAIGWLIGAEEAPFPD